MSILQNSYQRDPDLRMAFKVKITEFLILFIHASDCLTFFHRQLKQSLSYQEKTRISLAEFPVAFSLFHYNN